MRSDSTPVSAMSRNPGLNRGPTDYETLESCSGTSPLASERLALDRVFGAKSTRSSRRFGRRFAASLTTLRALSPECFEGSTDSRAGGRKGEVRS